MNRSLDLVGLTQRAGEDAVCHTASVATISEITENADRMNKVRVVPYSSCHLQSNFNLYNMYRNHSLIEKKEGRVLNIPIILLLSHCLESVTYKIQIGIGC